ncbi:MAG TPA: ROK family protein [Polyangiaceae bacterium]|nr:ROK family protein [Polyangiaceae bacterium]
MRSERFVFGVDLGGTKIEGALLEPAEPGPRVFARRRVPTRRDEGYDAIVERTARLVRELVAEAGLAALPPVGVGMPGSVSRRTGLVKNSNTTCLNGRPFRDDLRRALDAPVAFGNDADCFALAEARWGAARGFDDGVVFGAILGTGVGGGWVLRGRTWQGPNAMGGEWGHHALAPEGGRPCYCGRSGCVETALAGPALEASYERRSGRRLPLAEIVARRASDPHAGAVVGELLDAFGRAFGNVLTIVDPDVVVLGGGLSNIDLLYDEGRAAVARHVFNDELVTPVVRAELGDSAGVFGAALLAL